MRPDEHRQRVALAGQAWRLRLVAWAERPSPKTKRELAAAADVLDAAIAAMIDAAYLANFPRRRRK